MSEAYNILETNKNSAPKNRESLKNIVKKWLSVAESQVCALEVLSSQLPKLNELLEDNMIDLSTSFNILAEQARNQSGNVSAVSQSAKIFIVNGYPTTFRELLVIFHKLIDDAKENKHSEKNDKMFNDILAAVCQQEQSLSEKLKKAECSSDDMITAVSSAVVGMQFQDRVSQNLVIATNVSREIIYYLKDAIGITIENLEDRDTFLTENGGVELDKDFAMKMIQHLTLGELQQKFIDHLIHHKYITDPSQIGFNSLEKGKLQKEHTDEVELF